MGAAGLMLKWMIDLTEKGWIPSPLVRMGVRKLCKDRLQSLSQWQKNEGALEQRHASLLKGSPVAVATAQANQQHYEVPAAFFLKVLGPERKYSCAYWPEECRDLAEAEKRAFDITIERAQLKNGMRILELGCGWGSLTLEMAKRFPESEIIALSNSNSQREFILNLAKSRGLHNLKVLTRDVSALEEIEGGEAGFDRVVSVEMFEHFLNYEILLSRIRSWLKPKGKLFVHIFTHRNLPYLFETQGEDNWMGRYFFTGGQMPSHSLFSHFQKDLHLEQDWRWDGGHYQKTSEAWLENHLKRKAEILPIFESVYGEKEAEKWYQRWKVFFLAVSELFGFDQGQQWGVSHYLFIKKG